jgi:ATP-binding protein involved in chromosome partitioning
MQEQRKTDESEMLADTPSINGMAVKIVLLFPRGQTPFLKSTVLAAEAAITTMGAEVG